MFFLIFAYRWFSLWVLLLEKIKTNYLYIWLHGWHHNKLPFFKIKMN